MHKLILIFYIPRFAQTTHIESKVRGWWWRVDGQIQSINGR